MKILLACGGTGGHIYPALALAEKIRETQNDCFFVGSSRLEKDLVPRAGFRFYEIAASRKSILLILKGFLQSLQIIRREKPEAVLSTGGYVTFPVLLAALLLHKPIYLQEQNLLPGKVNRFLTLIARRIFTSFPDSAKYFPADKVLCTGNPVRQSLTAIQPAQIRNKILVFGGSLSAKSINAAVGPLKSQPDFQDLLIHLDGTNYCHNMDEVYRQALLVVCRAGATTLAEISVLGLPAILIPYPLAAENHQELNARYFQERGAAEMILDKDLTPELLQKTIKRLLADTGRLQAMAQKMKALGRPNAAAEITARITQTKKI